ncbi:MAG: alpha/beta hydrolase [Steroidobacteraceae bacterium]|jgi:pimeloyl-ACP methyl ester carboxylesterase|nr:alpha/beta hydrolase [Steroidobacteraceae bacterium]
MSRIRPPASRFPAFLLAAAWLAASASAGAADGAATAKPAAVAAAAPALRFQVVEGAGGVPLNVVTAGDRSKPPILLVHGIGQSYVSWEHQLKPPVTDQFYVVAFDLRGHGNSGKPWSKESYTDYRNYAGDVKAVIEATGLDRPLLVGWSYGTLVVADYVRTYGTSGLRGIELVGAYGGFTPPPAPAPAEMAAQMARTRELQLSGSLEDNIAAARGGVRFLTARDMGPAYWERATQLSLMLPAYARRHMFDRPIANMDLIPKIGVPMLVNVGVQDRSTPEAPGRELAAKVPGSRVSVYPDSGHSPFAEEPERFNRELIEFARAVLR